MNINISASTGKAIIIFGKQANGKSTLARTIANDLGKFMLYHGSHFTGKNKENHFVFSECSHDTKAIIIEECAKDFPFADFFNNISNGVTVEKKLAEPFRILPIFIFVSQHKPNLSGGSFEARFELIDIEQLNSNLYQLEN